MAYPVYGAALGGPGNPTRHASNYRIRSPALFTAKSPNGLLFGATVRDGSTALIDQFTPRVWRCLRLRELLHVDKERRRLANE